jgi:DNA-binding transcriptional LysR family regulator
VADPQDANRDWLRAGLTVGFAQGVTVTKWTRTWAERFPRVSLHVIGLDERDQRAALDELRVDMCFVRLPVPEEGLHLIPLYEEVPVVIVPKDHPVSLFEKVALADLSEENVLDATETGDAIDLIAGGAGVLFAPQSVARSHSRRDLVHRPVSDGTPTRVSLAWLVDNPNELIEEFIGIVRGRTANSSRSRTPMATDRPAKQGTPPKRTPPGAKKGGAGGPGKRRGR